MRGVRAYCRVSTDIQDTNGVSLEVQETRIRAYCVSQNIPLIKVYKDVCSGKTMNRPQYRLMAAELEQGDIVAVVDLSRLSRSTRDNLNTLHEFEDRGIGFVSITQRFDTSTPEGRAMMTIVMAFNQMERENISRKVSTTMRTLSDQGKLRGKPPFGWKFVSHDKDFEQEPNQQLIIKWILEAYACGATLSKIADTLNQHGYNKYLKYNKPNPEDGSDPLFWPQTIKRILLQNGAIVNEGFNQKNINKRIKTHHK